MTTFQGVKVTTQGNEVVIQLFVVGNSISISAVAQSIVTDKIQCGKSHRMYGEKVNVKVEGVRV